MRLAIEWLNEYSSQNLDVDSVVDKLTLSGLECELTSHKKKPIIDLNFTISLMITKVMRSVEEA